MIVKTLRYRYYKHYKGNIYKIDNIGTNTKNLKEYVIYHKINDIDKIWIREYHEFFGKVKIKNKTISRFEPLYE